MMSSQETNKSCSYYFGTLLRVLVNLPWVGQSDGKSNVCLRWTGVKPQLKIRLQNSNANKVAAAVPTGSGWVCSRLGWCWVNSGLKAEEEGWRWDVDLDTSYCCEERQQKTQCGWANAGLGVGRWVGLVWWRTTILNSRWLRKSAFRGEHWDWLAWWRPTLANWMGLKEATLRGGPGSDLLACWRTPAANSRASVKAAVRCWPWDWLAWLRKR